MDDIPEKEKGNFSKDCPFYLAEANAAECRLPRLKLSANASHGGCRGCRAGCRLDRDSARGSHCAALRALAARRANHLHGTPGAIGADPAQSPPCRGQYLDGQRVDL